MNSPSRSTLLDPWDPLWSQTLAAVRYDVYHLPVYSKLDELHEAGEARAYVFQDSRGQFFLPLKIRTINGTEFRDATSPYGYPGPLLRTESGSDMSRFLSDAIREMQALLQDHGIVSVFCRMHPLMDLPLEPLREAGTLVVHGPTVSIDLSKSDDQMWAELRDNHKRGVRNARNAGAQFERDQRWDAFEAFVHLYHVTMRRQEAAASYYFPLQYFEYLRDTMKDDFSLLTVSHNGKVISAGLFSECNGIVEYHLSGTDEQFLHLQPLKLLLHETGKWARNRGNSVFHLGGGLGARKDGLLNYKLGFSKVTSDFRTWRLITNPLEYEKLTAAWLRQAGGSDAADNGYFPAYRSPCQSPM